MSLAYGMPIEPHRGPEVSRALVHGRGLVVLRTRDGQIKAVREFFPNIIVCDGLSLLASGMGQSGAAGAGAQEIGIGEDSGAIDSGDATISTEVGSRVNACFYLCIPNWYESSIFASGNPGGGASVRQCGILTSATGGVLFAKGSFAVVNKATSDSLTIAWTFSLA